MKCEHITYNCQVKGNISMSQTSQPLQGNSLTTALGRDTIKPQKYFIIVARGAEAAACLIVFTL